jgi:hypothetical protein
MPEQKIVQDPAKNAYQVGIAHRLRVDPKRVNCIVSLNPKGGFLIDVAVDGRDLTGPEQKLVGEYLEEALHGLKPSIVNG